MTDIDIDAIRKLTDNATDGPWTSGVRWEDPCDVYWLPVNSPSTNAEEPHQPDRVALIRYETCGFQFPHADAKADAEFIAAARTLVPALCDEVEQLRAKLDKPCGSCHPCTNYRDETWRAANRKPPHVIEWDDAQAELKALRQVAEAAKAWRAQFRKPAASKAPRMAALIVAVDALPNPADHLDICPGYGCPGCREAGTPDGKTHR